MSTPSTAACGNRIIAALPREDRQRFIAGSEAVDLEFGEDLALRGARIREVYFPLTGFISLVSSIDRDSSLEVGLIGNEGMLGSALALGVNVSPLHALVQGSGGALRMQARRFGTELERSTTLRSTMQRYLYVMMTQMTQGACCMRYHVLEARLARWLLMTRDRAHSDHLFLTQEFLAFMLGVRRVGVTRAAMALQQAGLIGYNRGHITVLDGAGLEAASCSCYASDKATYLRVMQGR